MKTMWKSALGTVLVVAAGVSLGETAANQLKPTGFSRPAVSGGSLEDVMNAPGPALRKVEEKVPNTQGLGGIRGNAEAEDDIEILASKPNWEVLFQRRGDPWGAGHRRVGQVAGQPRMFHMQWEDYIYVEKGALTRSDGQSLELWVQKSQVTPHRSAVCSVTHEIRNRSAQNAVRAVWPRPGEIVIGHAALRSITFDAPLQESTGYFFDRFQPDEGWITGGYSREAKAAVAKWQTRDVGCRKEGSKEMLSMVFFRFDGPPTTESQANRFFPTPIVAYRR